MYGDCITWEDTGVQRQGAQGKARRIPGWGEVWEALGGGQGILWGGEGGETGSPGEEQGEP